MSFDLDELRFDDRGLLPAVAQSADSGRVLMLAWVNREAVERTLATGEAHFWSRSRAALWRKGESSGHRLRVERLELDCDGDALLLQVRPAGPACHNGTESCFDRDGGEDGELGAGRPAAGRIDLAALERIVADRATTAPEGSYTAKLLREGLERVAQKVGEEATELVIAAVGEARGSSSGRAALVSESADLLFHLAVLLRSSDVGVAEIEAELARRHVPAAGAGKPE
ncbi:MAG: bifunctional phosphoribosyl-AMP cyclohydrolase/phosphoribosyl-ATP diphosphatase HisIE [Thermoanaerobaculia bacterium]